MKLAVCYPWSVPWISTGFTDSALNLKHPEGCEVRFFRGEGWASARRHIDCCEQAITWGATHICIIGADQDHPPDMLVKLVGHIRRGVPAVTALVPMRGFNKRQGQKPFQTVGWQLKSEARAKRGRFDYTDFEHVTRETHGDLVEINAGGTGVLLFPVSALAKIPKPWFKETGVGDSFKRGQCADTPFLTALQAHAGLTIYADTTIDVGHYHTFRVDRTFSERFADWEEGGGDPSICSYTPPADMSRINQVRVSPSIPFYDEKFRNRYGLRSYDRSDEPAFFFGCYSQADIEAVRKHTGPAVVIWAGTDALNMRKALEGTGKLPFGPNVHHIAISSFIEDDLKALGIPFKSLPLCCVDEAKFQPVPLGRAVYCYCPDRDRDKYGGPLLDEIMALSSGVEFHIQRELDPTADMAAIYAKCGLGLRLTGHDGLSNTCVELGLMGRRVLWRCQAPNSVSFSNAADAAYVIKNILESGEHYAPVEQVATQTRNWLNIGDDWKTTAFYAPAQMVTMTPEIAAQPYDYKTYFNMRYEQGELGAGGPPPGSIEAELTIARIRALLKQHRCKTVVEVGCGSCARWDKLPEGYIGIDVSPKACKHALAKFPDNSFLPMDVTRDVIPQADAVIAIDVFQHIKHADFEKALREILNAANKLVVIKTTVDLNENYYQFKHDWDYEGWTEEPIPGVPHSRFFIFEKQMVAV